MNAGDFEIAAVRISFETAKAIVHQCYREFLLPGQVLARNLGLSLGEPTIIKIPRQQSWILPEFKDFAALDQEIRNETWTGRHKGEQQDIFLSIVSQIARAMPDQFADVAYHSHGTKRKYFGKSREEVEQTGSSNEALLVPETDWWASVNNAYEKKEKTLMDLMKKLGFSYPYRKIISAAPYRRFPEILWFRFSL